ncbi:MAG: thiamine-phosphate kinase [bacterium]
MAKNKEREIIELITGKNNRFVGDDSALWAEKSLVVATDHVCEGVHFDFSFMPPDAVGWRLMAANASDIISMGSLPNRFLFNIAIPKTGFEVAKGIIEGVKKFAGKYDIELMGGDTTRGESFMACVTMFGEMAKKPLLRSGAKVGDSLYLAASTGLSHCGFLHLKNSSSGFEKSKKQFLYPDPFKFLPENFDQINGAIDISDSLISELNLIAEMSGVSIEVDYDALPVDSEVKKSAEMFNIPLEKLIFGSGEEFFLLFTSDKEVKKGIKIGKVCEKKGENVKIFSKKHDFNFSGDPIFNHFC